MFNKTTLGVTTALSAGVAGLSAYYSKRRDYLSTRMNILSMLLLDPNELFPTGPFPEHDKAKQTELITNKRNLWADLVNKAAAAQGQSPIGQVVDVRVPSRDQGRSIPCRLYQPRIDKSLMMKKQQANHSNLFPVVVEMHGGGWTFGSVDAYDEFCRILAERGQCIVCSIEYRLAPEYRFPCGLEDCEDVFLWVNSEPEQITKLGGRPKEMGLAVCGDSAGGNLAAILAVQAANQWNIKVDLQVLIYPATCAFGVPLYRIQQQSATSTYPVPLLSTDSPVRFANAPILPLQSLLFLWQSYLGTNNLEEKMRDPRVSPALYTLDQLKSTAPCYLVTGSADVLLDEARAHGKALKKAGVPVVHRHYEDAIHGFVSLKGCSQHEECLSDLGDYVNKFFENRNHGSPKL